MKQKNTLQIKQTNKRSGFTLIELLVVTTIIILLTTMGVVSYRRAGETARDGKRKADLETVKQALVLYRADNSGYLSEATYAEMVKQLADDNYLSIPTPFDPQGSVGAPGYTYAPTGGCSPLCNGFTLTATLEDETSWAIYNP